jgi:1-deoxy-D-xylulose-5-phosphate synthase
MQALLRELVIVKQLDGPILLHVVTQKGRGCVFTEEDPVTYHSPSAFDKEKGDIKGETRPSYSKVFADTMLELAETDPRVVAVTAAMAQGTGLERFAERFPERFFDVGIAEQHAVAFSAGLTKSGLRPVAAIYSSFLQRAYDQVFHEVCLQNLPVVFAIDRAGITGGDGATAQGTFDIAYLRNLPQMTILAPWNATELKLMLRFAIGFAGPIAVRYPRTGVPEENPNSAPEPVALGKGAVIRQGSDVALFALGSMVTDALGAADILKQEGVSCAVINTRFAKPVDWQLLADWLKQSPLVVTIEDHALHAGFGSAVLEAASDHGLDANRIRRLGIPDRFIDHGNRNALMEALGLCPKGIANSVRSWLNKTQS